MFTLNYSVNAERSSRSVHAERALTPRSVPRVGLEPTQG